MPDVTSRGRLVVLAGPTAVGKSTVVKQLRNAVTDLYFSVSMTTRAPRPGETDGIDYYFVTPEQFQQTIDNGEMLEWAEVHSGLQRSGTPAQPVNEALAHGRPVLVEVDLEGARNVKAKMPEATTLFLAPPSWDVLCDRLSNRGTEPDDVVRRRLETAQVELDAQGEFDHIVVNDDLDKAVETIRNFLQS